MSIRLYSKDLWEKYGFGDGDLLSEWSIKMSDDREDFIGIDDKLLRELVTRHLLPALNHAITLEPDYSSVHNELLAVEAMPPDLAPEFVDVSDEDVLALARELVAQRKA